MCERLLIVFGGSFCQGRPNGHYVNPDSCTSFIQCSNNIAYTTQCSSGLYYNPDPQICDWPSSLSPDRKTQCGL